ncbi:MAG TPA: radical SAM protein [Chitinivibrionales bacterium]|nr:radical SAM protein [Chitinivibrionales bacterium]
MRKKVLFVNSNTELAPYPVPPVGLCLLASAIKESYEARVFDGLFTPSPRLPDAVREFAPDYVCLGVRNVDNVVIDNPVYYLDAIKERFVTPVRGATGAPLIAGGSGFSMFPPELMELSGADYGIVGEGEKALPALLAALDCGRDPAGIPGVITKQHGAEKFAPPRFDGELAALPFSEIDKWIDFSPYRQRGAYALQTKRGCGRQCIYCTYPCIEGTAFRLRGPESVADEIQQASARLGNVMFEFVDSTFNDPPGHAEAICREIVARKIKARLRTMGINPAHASRELFELMRWAGFSQIDCTPDSGSAEMLRNLKKNFSVADLEKTARLIGEADIPTMWFFIFGGPGETRQTMAETFAFIDKWVNPDDMVYMMAGLRIYPGTQLHRAAIREGVVGEKDSLLEPVFYVSPLIGKDEIDRIMKEASRTRHNCIPAAESTPPPGMMKKAMEMREKEGLKEPMFRTLLRIRREIVNKK